jgi:Tfp pilus assembly protein PilF
MKQYAVFDSESTRECILKNTCITKATKEFIKTLQKPARFDLHNKHMARIYYKDNYSMTADFVIMEV